jgi:hypothetical protein
MMLASCGQSAGAGALAAALRALDDGRIAWEQRKQSCGEYTYDRTSFDNPGAPITTVHIAGDIATWREYTVVGEDAAGPEGWIEEGSGIGSHAGAFPADTVEELYQECETVVRLVQATEYSVMISDGVPTLCRWLDGICIGDLCSTDLVDVLGFSCGAMQPASIRNGSSLDGGSNSAQAE